MCCEYFHIALMQAAVGHCGRTTAMDASEFRTAAAQLIDFITDYQQNIRSRPVSPSVSPGYLRHLVPSRAPEQPETWQQVRRHCGRCRAADSVA